MSECRRLGAVVFICRRHGDVDSKREEPVMVSRVATALKCSELMASGVGIKLEERPVTLITDFNGAHVCIRLFPCPTHLDFPWDTFNDIIQSIHPAQSSLCIPQVNTAFLSMKQHQASGFLIIIENGLLKNSLFCSCMFLCYYTHHIVYILSNL